MTLLLFILFSFFKAYSYDPKLLHLATIPGTRGYVKIETSRQLSTIKLEEKLGTVSESREVFDRQSISFNFSFNKYSYLGINMDYLDSRESPQRYGQSGNKYYNSSGFREPSMNYVYRLRSPTTEKDLLDIYTEIAPSINQRVTGRTKGNQLRAQGSYSLGIKHGSQVPGIPWETLLDIKWTYFTDGSEEDRSLNIYRRYNQVHDLSSTLNIQYETNYNLRLQAGMGFIIHGDIKTNTGVNIQRGTSIINQLRTTLPLGEFIASAGWTFTRNEYFIRQKNNSFDGDYKLHEFDVSLIKSF